MIVPIKSRLSHSLNLRLLSQSSPRDLLVCSVVVSLLVGVFSPALSLITSIPVLAALGLAGLCYLGFIVLRDTVLEGVFAGLFVLSTFSAQVPLVDGPTNTNLELLLVDPVLVTALVLLTALYSSGQVQRPNRITLLPLLFAGFIGWTAVSAFVSNGPSQSTAVFFTIGRVRMLTILLAVFAVTTIYGFKHVVLAYLPPLAVHVTIALAEGLRGAAFGLTVLGDKTGDIIANKTLLGLSYTTGLFPGGFLGTSRSLLAVLFLIAPVTAVVLVDKSEGTARWWLLMLVPITFVLLLADTASGLGAYLLLLGLVSGYDLLARLRSVGGPQSLVATGVSILCGLLLITVNRFSKNRIETSSADSPSSAQSTSSSEPSSAQSTSSSEPSSAQSTLPEMDGLTVFELLPSFLTDNLGIRVWLASTALGVALQYPLFGLGGANFQLLSEELGLQYGLTPHNTYLSVLVEFGIPGFILFMSAIGYTYYATLRLAKEHPIHRDIWAMVAAGLLTFHAFNFWVSLYYSSTVYAVFWAFAAAIVGEYATECESSPRVKRIRGTLSALR